MSGGFSCTRQDKLTPTAGGCLSPEGNSCEVSKQLLNVSCYVSRSGQLCRYAFPLKGGGKGILVSCAASISRRRVALSLCLPHFLRLPPMRFRSAHTQLRNRLAYMTTKENSPCDHLRQIVPVKRPSRKLYDDAPEAHPATLGSVSVISSCLVFIDQSPGAIRSSGGATAHTGIIRGEENS